MYPVCLINKICGDSLQDMIKFKAIAAASDTGCSLNIVFFSKILKYSALLLFSVFSRCQCVYTHQAGRKPALQQNWQNSERSQNVEEKNNI